MVTEYFSYLEKYNCIEKLQTKVIHSVSTYSISSMYIDVDTILCRKISLASNVDTAKCSP